MYSIFAKFQHVVLLVNFFGCEKGAKFEVCNIEEDNGYCVQAYRSKDSFGKFIFLPCDWVEAHPEIFLGIM